MSVRIPKEYYIGRKFGRLTAIRVSDGTGTPTNCKWECKCDCGNVVYVLGSSLRNGNTKSCGCLAREMTVKRNTTHGLTHHPLRIIYAGMKQRCYYKKDTHYQRYGGRGISICNEWKNDFKKFYDWAIGAGWKPGLTIDRIDNDGNYEPSNCRWIPLDEQYKNRSDTRLITCNGETHSLTEWARISGNYHKTIAYRLDHGFPVEEAIFGRRYEYIRKKNRDRKLQGDKQA